MVGEKGDSYLGISIMSNVELEEKMAQEEERFTETAEENDERASLVQKSPVLKVLSFSLSHSDCLQASGRSSSSHQITFLF